MKLLSEASLNRLIKHRLAYDSGAISGYRHSISHNAGNKNNALIVQELREEGYHTTMVEGFYQEQEMHEPSVERTVFVFDKDNVGGLKEKLMELGRKFNQETILFKPANGGAKLIRTGKRGFGRETPESKKTHYGKKNGPAWTNVKHKPFTDDIDIPDDFFD